jgi:tetratricopeptide (TPR) repeat protein
MAELKPSLAAYSRISYARELLGDIPGAIEAMELALDAARGAAEPTAWTQVQLGKLHFSRGDLDTAETLYRKALETLPDYVYALEALALVEAARGNLDDAVLLTERAAERIPLPQLVAQLHALYELTGDEAQARRQRELMEAINELLIANGALVDLETAVYYADHGIRPDEAVELARRARADRPSIYGDDALAWALARSGRCEEALPHAKRSLRLGTRDALLFFHRGYVERCLGREEQARTWFARAIALNPYFSLVWAPVAKEALS